MDALLAKEAANQWSIDHDIDWNLSIRYPFWFRRSTYIGLISQIYHGERLTQRACRRLLTEIDDPLLMRFLAYQLADEEKHEAVFARYIGRMGDVAPIEPALERPLEKSLTWRGSEEGTILGLMISFHIVLEGGALMVLDQLARRFPCPLFRNINFKVMADEDRHHAFGLKYVRDRLSTIDVTERREIFAFVAELWRDSATVAAQRYSFPTTLAMRMQPNWLVENWLHQQNQLVNIGLVTKSDAAAIVASLR